MRKIFALLVCFAMAPVGWGQIYNVSFLIKNAPKNFVPVSAEVARSVMAATRAQAGLPSSLIPRMQRSIVQIARPSVTKVPNPSVSASGFLLKTYDKIFVVSAFHTMGGVGSERVVSMPGPNGSVHRVTVKVNASGMTGWHSADVALAEINPKDIPAGMEPLTLGEVNLKQPAFSAGYMTGLFGVEDFLVARRNLFNAEGFNLLGTYEIVGASWEKPLTGNGQCGAPVVQQAPGTGEWQVVGVHNGHCLNYDDQKLGRGSAVNLAKTVPYLLDASLRGVKMSARALNFRGYQVTRLDPYERVSKIVLRRNGEVILEQDMKMFANPYSDARSELALTDMETLRGDELEYHILRHSEDRKQRTTHIVQFVIP